MWFLGASMRVFLAETSIWICRLSEEDGRPQCREPVHDRLWSIKGLNTIKNAKGSLSAWAGRSSSPTLRPWCSWFLGLPLDLDQDISLTFPNLLWSQTGSYIGSPGSQTFQFGLELHPWLSLASNLQMADSGPLRLHNHMSKPLIINLSLSISIYPISSVFPEKAG